MIALAIALGALFGIGIGMGLGRYFCKWHHKDDVKSGFAPVSKPNSRYDPLAEQEDVCGPCGPIRADQGISTIGDELKSVKECGCSPGCCGIGPAEDCCGDKNCGKC